MTNLPLALLRNTITFILYMFSIVTAFKSSTAIRALHVIHGLLGFRAIFIQYNASVGKHLPRVNNTSHFYL